MVSPSVSTHRGVIHWQRLLLLVSLLNFWSLPTTDQISILSTHCIKGEDVILRVRDIPPEAVALVWYKGESVDRNNVIAFFIVTSSFPLSGPENDQRQTLTEDGSLMTKQVTMMDSGMYTVVAYLLDSETEIGYGQLDVYEPLRMPLLIASSYRVRENEDGVVMTCYTNGISVQWLFNGMCLKFTGRMKVSADGRKITINPVLREDAGDYICKASNPIMWIESEPIHLRVLY